MSLRARLIIGVVALTTLGLIVAGAVVYAEQRGFLFDRADQQADAALPVVRRALEDKGILTPALRPDGPERPIGLGGGRPDPRAGRGRGEPERGRGPEAGLPSTLYGQARDAAGRVLGTVTPRLPATESAPAAPKLPDDLAAGERRTVDAAASAGPRYRIVADATPAGGLVIAAIPLTEVDAALSELLLTEGLVFGAVLLALGAGAWWIVRVGLRPLDAIGATAGAIAAGDLARRVEPADPRTEVGRLGLSLNAMLARREEAFAERRAGEERLRRFERFWRADPGRGRGRAGAGLGPAIVAGVVTAHGGRASAADAAGGGARFEVVLALSDGAP